jgi:serine/threonine protein kinase
MINPTRTDGSHLNEVPPPVPLIPAMDRASRPSETELLTPVPIPATPTAQFNSSEKIHRQPSMYVGRQLGKYLIHEQIGRGAMSWVFRATNTVLDMPLALKVMHPSVALFHRNLLSLFKREARLTLELAHPNIVRVYDFDSDQGAYLMAMEFVSGMSCGDLVASLGPMGESMVLRLTMQVMEALEYAHERGVVHRDVKPSNILVGKNSSAKLTDFGLARVLGQLPEDANQDTSLLRPVGTPNYWAPEQLDDPINIDHRIDFYSLGVTMFELMTGVLPYRGANAKETSELHRSAPIPNPRKINPAITPVAAGLIQALMEKDPAKRPQTHGEIIQSIRNATGGTVTQAG